MEWKSRLKPAPAPQEEEVLLGRVVGVFGLDGEVRLHLENRESELLTTGREVVLIGGDGERFTAHVSTRPGTNHRVLARIRGVDDREVARTLQDVELWIERSGLPSLDEDEYYLSDLVGMDARCGERPLGRVVAVHTNGPVEVIELDGDRYVPSTLEAIEAIDLDARILFVKEGAVAV